MSFGKSLTTLIALSSLFTVSSIHTQTLTPILHEIDHGYITEIIHGDFNDDGMNDFVITGSSVGYLSIGMGNGIEIPTFQQLENDFNLFELEVIDYDQDGDLDFVGSAPFEDNAVLYNNDGSGNFERLTLNLPDYTAIHFVDIDGDESMNIILATGNRIVIYNLTNGTASSPRTIFEDSFAGSCNAIETLDYDEDGDLDIVVTFARDGLFLFTQNNATSFSELELYGDTFNDDELYIADFNGDAVPDFVTQSDFERRSSLILSTSTNEYTEIPIPNGSGPSIFSLVTDLNEDGNPEIIKPDGEGFGDSGLYRINYNAASEELETMLLFEDYSEVDHGGAADLDNDGDIDLYFYVNGGFDEGLLFLINEGDFTSSSEDYTLTGISIYPNPVDKALFIETEEQMDFNTALYTLNGQAIDIRKQRNRINLSGLESGIYLLEITDKDTGKRNLQKVIINR